MSDILVFVNIMINRKLELLCFSIDENSSYVTFYFNSFILVQDVNRLNYCLINMYVVFNLDKIY